MQRRSGLSRRNFVSLFTRRMSASEAAPPGRLRLVSIDVGAALEGMVRPALTARFSSDHKGFTASIQVTS